LVEDQITPNARIAKATVIGSTTVFRLPHAAPHVCDSGGDLTDAEWALVEPMIPPAKRGGARGFERYARSAAAFVRLVMIRIMLKTLDHVSSLFRNPNFLDRLF
jgi:hypothetical protein